MKEGRFVIPLFRSLRWLVSVAITAEGCFSLRTSQRRPAGTAMPQDAAIGSHEVSGGADERYGRLPVHTKLPLVKAVLTAENGSGPWHNYCIRQISRGLDLMVCSNCDLERIIDKGERMVRNILWNK